MPRFRPFAALTSPQSYNLLAFSVGILAAGVVLWAVATILLWLGGIVITILLVLGLAAAVYWKGRGLRERERRIADGECAACGYDFRGSGRVCPECGRDSGLDEPTWRKRQREHQLLLRAAAAPPPPVPPSLSLTPPPADLTPAPPLR